MKEFTHAIIIIIIFSIADTVTILSGMQVIGIIVAICIHFFWVEIREVFFSIIQSH